MKYNVVVVGAGSAGCALAARISEDPSRTVILLEAGPDYPDPVGWPDDVRLGNNDGVASAVGAPHNWSLVATATPYQDKPMQIPRGKIVGGSSAINTQSFPRGEPEDYDNWAAWGNDEWSFVKLLPYFRRMERDLDFGGDFHGTEGPIPVRRHKPESWLPFQWAFHRACRDAGYPENPDMNAPGQTGVGPTPTNNLDGVRVSAAMGYVDPARHRLNLTVRGDVLATRILFDGKRAVGVEVESGGDRFVVEGDEVVLSAGAVASPHLMMLSGVGRPELLSAQGISLVHELPGVGRNLRDHPSVHVVLRAKDDSLMDPTAPRTQLTLHYTATGSANRNDVEIWPTSFWVPIGGDPLRGQGMSFSCVITQPVSSGEVTISSPDPHVQPHLNYNFLDEPWDRERMRECVRQCLRITEHEAIRGVTSGRIMPADEDVVDDDKLDAWTLRTVRSMAHICGTCKMGPSSDNIAVVDQYGRVHGLQGLRIADASIMPDVIRATTNPTAIMIGERVADWMR